MGLPMWGEICVYLLNNCTLVLFLFISEVLFVVHVEKDFPLTNCMYPMMLYCVGGMLNCIIFKKHNFWTFAAYFYVFVFLCILTVKSSTLVEEIDEKSTGNKESKHSFLWDLFHLPAIVEKGVQKLPWSILLTPLWLLLIQSFGYIVYLKHHIFRTKRIIVNARQQLILILYFVSLFFFLLGALLVSFPELSMKIFHLRQTFYEKRINDSHIIFPLDPLPWILFYSSLLIWFGASYTLLEEWAETLQETGGYIEPVNLIHINEGWIPAEKEIKQYLMLGAVVFDKRKFSRLGSNTHSQRTR